MFENLTQGLTATLQRLAGKGRMTEDMVRESLREIRVALLEADVALPVVQEFVASVSRKAVGAEILQSLTPGQAMVKLVHDELVHTLGDSGAGLDLRARPPVVILMAGLQGSGKTSTTAKLARLLQAEEKKRVMVTSCDVYRPAAIEQLQTLANQIGAIFHPSSGADKPAEIAVNALTAARQQSCDVLIIDTAGRLHVDDEMMREIRAVHAAVLPHETLFVVDSMTGQDAANTAVAFNASLPLTGVVLTKTDGDARGGAALSMRLLTGKPIKFLAAGEKVDALQAFHPERVASRILGMGDVLSLVEEVQRKVDQEAAEKLVRKIRKGNSFDLEDFRGQLEQMLNLGGIGSLMEKMPGMSMLPENLKSKIDDRQTRRLIAMINSMTRQERRFPDIIRGSRKRRIASGSGTDIQSVNRLLKQHAQMQKMMKKFGKGGMGGMMKSLNQLQGRLGAGNVPGGNKRKPPF